MADSSTELTLKLQALSRVLQQLHFHVLEVERLSEPSLTALEWVDRLANDSGWAWLRAVSSLIADIDHALTAATELTEQEAAAVGAQARGVLFGEGDRQNEAFLTRYRPLLQVSASLASCHGEVKRLLDTLPRESENESDRLHARHLWAMRCRHRTPFGS